MNKITYPISDTYVEGIQRQIHDLKKQKAERIYLQVGGRLIGDKHAARVLPRYNPDTKLLLVRSLVDQAEYVYCISASDLDRGRIRGDNGLLYIDEVCRSLDELSSNGITVSMIIVIGTEDASRYGQIVAYAEQHNIRAVAWASNRSVLDEGFSITHFQNNKRLDFDSDIIVVLSPGSNSGKFDFCLQQLYLEISANRSVAYARLQIFPIPTLHPRHPINLAYFAATADTYSNEGLFNISTNEPWEAWRFYQKDKNINALLHEIDTRNNNESKIIEKIISIDSGINDMEEAEREGAAELLRRYMRYWQEVNQGKERPEVLAFTKRLVTTLFDQYPMH